MSGRRPVSAAAKTSTVPMVLMPFAIVGTIFQAGDVATIAAETGMSLVAEASTETLAAQLDIVAIDFVLASRAFSCATPGEFARWAKEVEKRAAGLLECFSASADSSDPIEAASRALRGPKGFIEANGLPLVPGPEFRSALSGIAMLAYRARLVAAEYDANKNGKRRPAELEIAFCHKLADIYRRAFGHAWSISTGRTGERSGASVRYLGSVARLLGKRIPDADPQRDGALLAAIQRLQTPSQAADRIRDVVSGGPVRKR